MSRSAIPIAMMMLAVAAMLAAIFARPTRSPKSLAVIEAEQQLCEARKRLNAAIDKCEAQHGKGACSVGREDVSMCKK